jgi:hypothetical protein
MCGVGRDLARHEVAHDDSRRATVDNDDVDEFGAIEEADSPETHLAGELLVGPEQELLPRLAAGVEGAAHLGPAERAVVEQSAVLAGEGHPLGHHLVDDVHAHLGQSVHVGLAGAEVAALDGVVEETVDAVTVSLVVLGGVDAALRCDRVGAPRRVVEGECVHLVAEFGQCRGRRGTGESRSDDDHLELPLVVRVHEFHVGLVVVPLVLHRSGGDLRVERHGVPGEEVLGETHEGAFRGISRRCRP